MRNSRLTGADLWTLLLLFLALLLGGVVRFTPAALSDFPLRDGGMFYVMIEELRANHFALPQFTAYNGLQIPYAYPPLGFYLAGLLAGMFRIDTLDLLRWLPAILSTLTIAAFYLVAAAMLESRPQAALGTFAFAMMPRSVSWFVLGGGLTRSLGLLFLLLTVYAVTMCLARGSRRHLWPAALFGGLACLSHPEYMLHTAAACALVAVFHIRSRAGLRAGLLIAAGALAVSAPWWLTVLLRFGPAPFLSAARTGGHDWFFWAGLLIPTFAEEYLLTMLSVLGLIGLGIQLVRRRWFLPAWLALPFVVEPRSATAVAILPLAMMAGVGLSELILPGLAAFETRIESLVARAPRDWTAWGMKSLAVRAALGYVMLMALVGAYPFALSLSGYHLRAGDRAAMQWVRENAPLGSRFVLVTGQSSPLADPVQEWFPALAARRSQSTIQGLEWSLADEFRPFIASLDALQTCANRGADCLDDWAQRTGRPFDYVYLDRYVLAASADLGAPLPELPATLMESLLESPHYEPVYRSDAVLIFRRLSP